MTAALKRQPQPTPFGPTGLRPPRLLSVEEYLESELLSEVKREYVAGQVYAMAGARNVHNVIAMAFLGLMHARLRGKPCQPLNSNTKVRIRLATHTRFYYPDAMIVCEGNPADDVYQDQPRVVVEVVSRSSRRTDEGEKRDGYLTIPSLTAYLLIDTETPRVVVHRRTSSGFDVEEYDGLTAIVPFADLGTSLPLAELYERVNFAAAATEDASAMSETAV